MVGPLDSPSVTVARAFFIAATKSSEDEEDILPQEDGKSLLSVFSLFAKVFPEHVKVKFRDPAVNGRSGLTRLQFNKLGYTMYAKEQSRRVPAPHAKPGNPGYGFKRARWRSPIVNLEDDRIMLETLMSIGVSHDRCDFIRKLVNEYCIAWDLERRPSRPAGPGRPRSKSILKSSCSASGTSRHEELQDQPFPPKLHSPFQRDLPLIAWPSSLVVGQDLSLTSVQGFRTECLASEGFLHLQASGGPGADVHLKSTYTSLANDLSSLAIPRGISGNTLEVGSQGWSPTMEGLVQTEMMKLDAVYKFTYPGQQEISFADTAFGRPYLIPSSGPAIASASQAAASFAGSSIEYMCS
jgi:hypothetical protein